MRGIEPKTLTFGVSLGRPITLIVLRLPELEELLLGLFWLRVGLGLFLFLGGHPLFTTAVLPVSKKQPEHSEIVVVCSHETINK